MSYTDLCLCVFQSSKIQFNSFGQTQYTIEIIKIYKNEKPV